MRVEAWTGFPMNSECIVAVLRDNWRDLFNLAPFPSSPALLPSALGVTKGFPEKGARFFAMQYLRRPMSSIPIQS